MTQVRNVIDFSYEETIPNGDLPQELRGVTNNEEWHSATASF